MATPYHTIYKTAHKHRACIQHAHLAALLLTFASIIMTSCDRVSGIEEPETVYFSALERDRFRAMELPDPGPARPASELKRVESIFTSLERNRDAFFAQELSQPRLDLVENAYMAAGRYLDFMDILRTQSKKQGLSAQSTERYAWGLIRLGQEQAALKLVDAMVRHDPKNPDAWFLYGAFWLKESKESDKASKKVILAWQRTVSIDAAYLGAEGVGAKHINQQLASMRAAFPSQKKLDKEVQKLFIELFGAPEKDPNNIPKPTPPRTPSVQEEHGAINTKPNAVPTAQPPSSKASSSAPEAKVKPAQSVDPNRVIILAARARVSIDSGDPDSAKQILHKLKHIHYKDTSLTSFVTNTSTSARALWILILAQWDTGNQSGAALSARALLKKKDITPEIKYSIANFSLHKLKDRVLATTLLTDLVQNHSVYATQVDAQATLDQMRQSSRQSLP